MRRIERWSRQALAIGSALGLSTLACTALAQDVVFAEGSKGVGGSDTYIVQLSAPPVVANAATQPTAGSKIDPNSAAVVSYLAQLSASHDSTLAAVGASSKIYSYGYLVNGFAAKLTAGQAEALSRMPGVLAVTRDEKMQLTTATTPSFIGLTGPNGVWQTQTKGENIVIGIIDSGVWPEQASFSGNGYGPLARWNGTCVSGEQFSAANCNNKLIGARFFNAGFGGNAGVKALFPYEYNSPRDADSHGTHTATTAGGNEGVSTAGSSFAAFGAISGIAPRARIAAYKVCYGRGGPPAGCFPSDSVAAIEAAIADGVDVINFSISGTTQNFLDPVETAFRRAAEAGIFVAASAGNSGPTLQTVAHPSPWIATVAAGTHNRVVLGTLTLGNGAGFSGASAATTAVPAGTPMILSTAAGLPGANPDFVRLCYAAVDNGGVAVLDPAKVAGRIVICDRGVTDRVNKSRAVAAAGGAGMVLVNTSANSLNPDAHSVPTIHISHIDGPVVKAYAGGASPTGAMSVGASSLTAPAPFVASFSSRGPSQSTGFTGSPTFAPAYDLLKPDIIGPGQDILAGISPVSDPNNQLFGLLSGTSMSSPHIAGLAALMKSVYPTWSPMAIKSAMMTTAGDILDGPNTNPNVIWAQGAGHVRPAAMFNPGLVYDSRSLDWQGFLCGQGRLAQPNCAMITMDASDLNVPSIHLGAVPTSQTVKRRVTNVTGTTSTFTASYTGLPGYTVTINPSTLTLGPGQTGQYTVTFVRTTAAIGSFFGGQLSWTNGTTTARIPMVVRATGLQADAPAQVAGSGALMKYWVNFGYTGPLTTTAAGPVPAVINTGSVSTSGTVNVPVVVPAGTTFARFSLFSEDSPNSDIDLQVLDPNGNLVGSSTAGASTEEVNLTSPAPGTYTVQVIGFNVPSGPRGFRLHSWAVGNAASNMTVYAPPFVSTGQQLGVSIIPNSFALPAGARYLGTVSYSSPGVNLPARTIVRIDR